MARAHLHRSRLGQAGAVRPELHRAHAASHDHDRLLRGQSQAAPHALTGAGAKSRTNNAASCSPVYQRTAAVICGQEHTNDTEKGSCRYAVNVRPRPHLQTGICNQSLQKIGLQKCTPNQLVQVQPSRQQPWLS